MINKIFNNLVSKIESEVSNIALEYIKGKLLGNNRFISFRYLFDNEIDVMENLFSKLDKSFIDNKNMRKSEGFYKIRYKRNLILYRVYEKIINNDSTLLRIVYVIGPDQKKIMNKINNYIYKNTCSENTISLVSCVDEPCRSIRLRDFSSVEIGDNKKLIVDTIDTFFNKIDLFEEVGVMHKLGILLYGEPGTGKTSTIKAIIDYIRSKFKSTKELSKGRLTVYNINCSNLLNKEFRFPYIDDSEKSIKIIILEDIDCVTVNREDSNNKIEYETALFKLLELLDGFNSSSNCITLATTNHMEKLDAALIREGRFDLKLEIGKIEKDQAIHMCKRFKLSDKETEDLLKDIEFPVNPSQLQNKIIYKL